MTDIKTVTRSTSKRLPKRSYKRKNIPRGPTNDLVITTSWSVSSISSGTVGTIAFTIAPAFSSSTEASGMSTLFSEVRLLAFKLFACSQQAPSPVAHSTLFLGTNCEMNATTNSAPTSRISVANLRRKKKWVTTDRKILTYNMYVPRSVMPLPILPSGSDVPTLVTPYAGSPGAILGWGDGFANSTQYLTGIEVTATFHLTGRV